MVGEPDPHGLAGYLKHLRHGLNNGLIIPAGPHLVETPLDHWHGHEQGGPKHIRLDLHTGFLDGRLQRRALPGTHIQPLMQDPVRQFVGLCKPQAAGAGFFFTQRGVYEDRAGFHREQDILAQFHVVHGLQAGVKNGFPQDPAILAEILELQYQAVALDKILDGDGAGLPPVEALIVGIQHTPGDALHRLLGIILPHARASPFTRPAFPAG